MTEESKPKNNVVQGLGIASLIFGVIALPVSFIPCCGALAIIPAILGVLMAGVGIVLARSQRASGGLSTAALVVSGIALLVVIFQITVFAKVQANAHQEQLQKQSPQ